MSLVWRVRGLSDASFGERRRTPFGQELTVTIVGALGRHGLSGYAQDLIDVGLAVFAIERSLPGNAGTNRPAAFEVELGVREPGRWTRRAREALEALLAFQGDAVWKWSFTRRSAGRDVNAERTTRDDRTIERVMLFSGGLDSTCGAATIRRRASAVQLISHYSKQKTKQQAIAKILGFGSPTQIRTDLDGGGWRGHTFLHRSFYFLCQAAAVASSYGVREIVQFENGILASAMPPSPAYFMTRHAHPTVHRLATLLFGEVLGGDWLISNPFLGMTKRQCVEALERAIGPTQADALIELTETCWYLQSYQLRANRRKPNGTACGVCIPCIIRRTAVRRPEGHYDLNRAKTRADAVLAREFNAYANFAARIGDGNANRLLLEMPAYVRQITEGEDAPLARTDLLNLFVRFARDFRLAFR